MKITEDFTDEPKYKKPRRLTKKQIADQWYESQKNNIDWSNGHNRQKFRETSYWQNFVKRVKKSYCEFCTCKTSRPNLHHLYPKKYDTLEKELFKTLCYSCHTKISQLSRRKDVNSVPEYFLPFLERSSEPTN